MIEWIKRCKDKLLEAVGNMSETTMIIVAAVIAMCISGLITGAIRIDFSWAGR